MCVALSLAPSPCAASRAEAESSTDVADFLSGHYDYYVQFGGQKDGGTRCAHN